jgi:hypothetical protein
MESLAEQPIGIEAQETIEHAGFIDGREAFSRQTIELEAAELIAGRSELSQPEVKRQEREDNARTALMEALTASGHLSRVELRGTIDEIYSQMIGRLLNGWDDNLPAHEKDRRFAELSNVLFNRRVHEAIIAGELPENTAVLENSDYPEALAGTNLGYRDSNKKGMLRSTHLKARGDDQYSVIIEQVSRSNGTWRSSSSFFNACGIEIDTRDQPGDVATLSTQALYNTYDYAGGAVDVMRILDRHQGDGVLYGDTGEAKKKHVSYEDLREESARREEDIEFYTSKLADLEEQLDGLVEAKKMTYEERMVNFKGEVHRILDAICRLEPAYAEATFGQRMAPIYSQASVLEAQGRRAEAAALLAENGHLAEPVTFCGVTMSADQAKQLGLKVNSVGDLVDEGKKNWKWKKGVCQVKVCPTRPGKTEVGPCSVCRGCQHKFDKGQDPAKSSLPLIPRKRGDQH